LLQREKARIALESTQEQMAKARKDFEDNKLDLKNGIVKLEQSIAEMEKNYNKMRNDYDLGLVTEFQLEQMEHQLNSLRLDLESSKNKLETLESTNPLSQMEQALETSRISIKEADRTLEHMEVKAPVSGVLTELPIEVGMTLPSGFSAAHIERLDPIKIKAELTEEAAKLVRGKKELTFYIPGEIDKTKAKVSYLADIMSSKTKSYTLELEVPNADLKLRPGMKAQILLTDEEDQMVVAVPALSVVREEGETYVFILKGDHVEKRKVELGRMNETVQEVISGVEEGELLVISGHNQLRDQEKVQVEK
jgi:RND family efflux transporter MFP subunit